MSNYKRDNLSPDNLVVKSNIMVQGKYKLTSFEQNLILTMCSKISTTDTYFPEVCFTVEEFCDLLEITNKDYEINRKIKRKCKELVEKSLYMNLGTKDTPDHTFFAWFSYLKYDESQIKARFNPSLEPYLLYIRDTYTKYRLGYVLKFKCEYTFRIYELLKQYQTASERMISIKDLKEMLLIEDIYKQYTHLKQRVILPAIKEINEKSDIKIELTEIKKARKVEVLHFTIQENFKNYYPIDNFMEYEKYKKKSVEELAEILRNLIFKNYKMEMDINTIKMFCHSAILHTIMELKEGAFINKDIKLPILYFTKVLMNKHEMITDQEITKADIRKYEIEQAKNKKF